MRTLLHHTHFHWGMLSRLVGCNRAVERLSDSGPQSSETPRYCTVQVQASLPVLGSAVCAQ
eukprot:15093182-Alexandrium_andersonii.AAC.1